MLRYIVMPILLLLKGFTGLSQTAVNSAPADSTRSKDSVQLREITVTAFQPVFEYKKGSIIMNVENNPLASGSTILELLKMIPGIITDAQGNLTLNGQGSVGIMLDGRLQQVPMAQLITRLSSTSADAISSIELIKNPSAKYDAAGVGGLINIATKKVKVKGFSGGLFENLSYGKQWGTVSDVSLNFKSDKLTVFTNVNYWYRDIITETVFDRSFFNTERSELRMKGKREAFNSIVTLKAGLEYELGRNTTAGFNASYAPGNVNGFGKARTDIASDHVLSYRYLDNITHNKEYYNDPSANLYILHNFDTNGTQLKLSADYTDAAYRLDNRNENRFLDAEGTEAALLAAYKNTQRLHFRVFSQKLDFTKMLGKSLLLETGVKSSFVRNISEAAVQQNVPGTQDYYTDSMFSNTYHYKEQILAGYVNLSRSFGKLNAQAGLRGEQTNINGSNKTNGYEINRRYFNLFPSLNLDYKLNEKNSLQFSYGYRIERPPYDQLNSYRIFKDPLNYSTGNPALQPQYSHLVTMDFNHNNFISTGISYMHTRNSVYQYSFAREGSAISIDTLFNYASRNTLTYTVFIQKQLSKWYQVQTSLSAIYSDRKGTIFNMDGNFSTLGFYGFVNNTIQLPGGYRLQLNGNYHSGVRDGIQQYSGVGSLDLAVQKKLFNNRLSVTLGVYDLLYTNYSRVTTDLPGSPVMHTKEWTREECG